MKIKAKIAILVIICLSLCLGVSIPVVARLNSRSNTQSTRVYRLDATTCIVCGKPINGYSGESSSIAWALDLDVCEECFLQILWGNDITTPILKVAQLGEDGKVLSEQLPAGQGGTAWGDITGLIGAQTDLQGALDSKETPAGAQSKVDTHNSTYNHADIAHINRTLLDATQESFTTSLKVAYDGAVANAHSNSLDHNGGTQDTAIAGKEPANANIQTHVTSAHAPSNAQKNSDITKAEIEAKLTGEISSHTHAGGSSGGGMTMLMKPSNQTINAGAATYTNITSLTFPVTAGNGYAFYFYIVFQSAATATGWKAGVNCPTGTLDFWAEEQGIANGVAGVATHLARHGVARDDMTLKTTTVTQAVDLVAIYQGRYLCTQDGTFAARFANELAANTNIVVQAGSWGWYAEAVAAK